MPFAVLGNKIDLPGAASEQELRIQLNLVDTFGKDVSMRSRVTFRTLTILLVSDPLNCSCAVFRRRLDTRMVGMKLYNDV